MTPEEEFNQMWVENVKVVEPKQSIIYGKHYPRFKVVRVIARLDKNGKTVYYQTLDPLWAKRISRDVVESLRLEGRLFLA